MMNQGLSINPRVRDLVLFSKDAKSPESLSSECSPSLHCDPRDALV